MIKNSFKNLMNVGQIFIDFIKGKYLRDSEYIVSHGQ